jgi:SAM-dependent methyltransferase
VEFETHRLSFGAAAAHYDKSRPSYPRTAIDFALGSAPLTVVDLGAGTGLLTRVLQSAGHHVIPVEPDPGMRAQLDDATPGTTALEGSAESIPLPDNSVDAVVAGQAYHWFDQSKAHPEVARVLRSQGIFAPMWNDRDLTTRWTQLLDEIMNHVRQREWMGGPPNFGPLFTEPVERAFEHSTLQTQQGLCDLVASRSYYLVSPPEQQAAILRQVRDLCETELTGLETFEMPYQTSVYRATLRS